MILPRLAGTLGQGKSPCHSRRTTGGIMKKILKSLLCTSTLALGAGVASAETLVGYVAPIAAQPGQQYLQKGMELAAAELGYETRTLDANLSSDRQVSHLDTLLTMGAIAIGTWSMDPNAVAGVFARAGEQGVPVIGVNSPGEGVTATVFWEINLCSEDGPFAQQAAYIAAKKPGAKVIIMGGPPVPSIMQNMECATKTSEAAGLTVVDRVDNVKAFCLECLECLECLDTGGRSIAALPGCGCVRRL